MKKIIFVFSLFLPVLLFSVPPSTAHPHVWGTNYMKARLNENGLKGFKIKWKFDEMFSSTLINNYDENKDGKFNSKEIKEIKSEMFSGLEKYNYFVHPRTSQEKIKIPEISNFTVSIDYSTVIYSFFVPCRIKINKNSKNDTKEISVAIYDETNYVALKYSDPPIKFIQEENSDFNISYEKIKNQNRPTYPDQINIKISRTNNND